MSISSGLLRPAYVSWNQGKQHVRNFVPPLASDLHKGSCGRIAVFGGSSEYTGAPYYGATAALKVGADLSFVLTAAEAALPIKCYGPELMVMPMYSIDDFDNARSASEKEMLVDSAVAKFVEVLPRVHTLLIGPGLGRHPDVVAVALKVVRECRARQIPMVIDADGLFFVAQHPDVVAGCDHVILTPNQAEFQRLVAAVFPAKSRRSDDAPPSAGDSSGNAAASPQEHRSVMAVAVSEAAEKLPSPDAAAVPASQQSAKLPFGSSAPGDLEFGWESPRDAAAAAETMALSNALGGVAVLRKGATDVVCDGNHVLMLGPHQEPGSPRRCGGVGDLLSGSTAVLLNWALRPLVRQQTEGAISGAGESPAKKRKPGTDSGGAPSLRDESPLLWAAWGASVLVKRSAAAAFSTHWRSTTAPDVLEQLGPSAHGLLDDKED